MIGQGHLRDPGASNPPVSLAAIGPFTGVELGDTAYPQVVPPGAGALPFPPADLPQAAAPGRAADTATVLLTATDEIRGTHRVRIRWRRGRSRAGRGARGRLPGRRLRRPRPAEPPRRTAAAGAVAAGRAMPRPGAAPARRRASGARWGPRLARRRRG